MRIKVQGKTLLANLKPGESCTVTALLFPQRPVMRRLMAIGLLPGEHLIVERTSPEFLIRFGFTWLALNRTVARSIVVDNMTVSHANR